MSNRTTEEKWDAEIDRWTPRRLKVWLGILVVLAVFGGIGVWAFGVATSDVKGRGDTIVRKNDADNRIAAQAFFEDTFAGIKRFDTQLNDADRSFKEWQTVNPVPAPNASSVEVELYKEKLNNQRTTVTGIQQQCRNAIAAYNAEARKTIRADWRSPDLPYQIDESDKTTDCMADAA